MEALEKGILYICNKYKNYKELEINNKINLKSEIAYYWNTKYNNGFQKHIRPIFQEVKNNKLNDFISQEYLFAVGL